MAGLLSGIKILDFTYLLPGPYATLMLGDLGAEVLKVESPTRVDLARYMSPFVDAGQKISYLHSYLGRNKRSIALDLKKEEACEIVTRLVEEAGYDIIIEQFRPGVMKRLGLGYDDFAFPGLIYCSLTGYGQTGSYSDRAGHDINYLSLSGVMSYSGLDSPSLMGIQVADMGSGSNNAVIGILAAVINRMNTGCGQHIDVSMTDGMMPYHAVSGIKTFDGEPEPGFGTELLSGGSLYGFYETSDGGYISFGGLEPQFFEAFCRVLGLEDLIAGGVTQSGNLEDARKKVSAVIKGRTRAYWMEEFGKVDACVEPVLSFSEAVSSELVKERGLVVSVPGPGGDSLRQISCPLRFSDWEAEYRSCGCELGRDTIDVLDDLDYSSDEIEELKTAGVFGEIE